MHHGADLEGVQMEMQMWIKLHWVEYRGLSGRAPDWLSLKLSLIKWNKDSLLDQFYSGFSEFSFQEGPDFFNSVIIFAWSDRSKNPA